MYSSNTPVNVDSLLNNRFYPPNRVPALEESIVQWQVYHALKLKQPIDILLLGDSSALMGLRPTIIQALTGLTCWNMGTLDYLSTPGNTDILELFLQQRDTLPKVIVYHIVSSSFSLSQKDLKQFGYRDRLHTWFSLALKEKQPSTMRFVLPSMRYRRSVQRFFTTFSTQEKEMWLRTPRGPYPSDNDLQQLLLQNQGAMTEVVRGAGVDKVRDLQPMLRVDPSVIPDIRRLMELCVRASIRLVIITNPIPEVSATAGNLQGLASLEAQLKTIAQGYDDIAFYEPFARFYPVQLCNTYNHLTEEGAIRNSEEVSRWLIDLLDLKTAPLMALSSEKPTWQAVPDNSLFVYEAESSPRQIGIPQADPDASGRQAVYAIKRNKAGFVVYGPYKSYASADYVASFRLKTDQIKLREPVVFIDVVTDAGATTLVKKELKGNDFQESKRYQEFQLPFSLTASKILEFRVYTFARADIWVDQVTVTIKTRKEK